eukprot:SAG22_NODE_18277_length_290_cov_0.675393_1_plen_52_part_10
MVHCVHDDTLHDLLLHRYHWVFALIRSRLFAGLDVRPFRCSDCLRLLGREEQ